MPHEGLSDTSPEIEARMIELYGAMTPRQRIARALSLSQATRQLTRARLRKLYPDASEDELRIRFAQRTLGNELTRAVFGRIYED
ncbi:MAG TPA: hypothetical protein VK034_07710 [Enhygromyxa sp.]|nr:hypothetical protein [Enhygromyxa sp.]